jgi:hypothetical protein
MMALEDDGHHPIDLAPGCLDQAHFLLRVFSSLR